MTDLKHQPRIAADSVLEHNSIICFAHDWGGDPTSKTHIMRILSRTNRILWVNSIGMRRPMVSRRDLRRMAEKLRRSVGGCIEAEPGLFVGNPLVFPLPGVRLADRLNSEILVAWLRRHCRRLGFERPILWTFLPNVSLLLGRLDEKLVIYHCVDEHSAFSSVPRRHLMEVERDLLCRADIVLTSSERLCEERRSLNPHTHFVPHGVETTHFSRALDPRTAVPDEVSKLPRPVVGFFGLIADWIDLELLRGVALARPGWSIALVGKAVIGLEALRGVANVHLLGQKPYSALPGYCRGFDVGIIPFRMNALTVRANPLKLREYLAAGLPVVSTPLPEVARYEGQVRLAKDVSEFTAGIEAALTERSPDMDRRRAETMACEGWESRVSEISAIVGARLGASSR